MAISVTNIQQHANHLLNMKQFWTNNDKARLYRELKLVLHELDKIRHELELLQINTNFYNSTEFEQCHNAAEINQIIRKIRNRLKVLPSEKTDVDYMMSEAEAMV